MGKSRKIFCPQCDNVFLPNKGQIVCSVGCAIAYNSEEAIEKRYSIMKEESKKLSEVLSNTKTVFQKFIRLRDNSEPCISCNRTETKQWDGGHFFNAEDYPGLIFNEDNVHKQCSYCNDHLKGNVLEYRKGLITKIGVERLEAIEFLSTIAHNKIYTKKELALIAWEYKQKIKSINKK